MLSMGAPTAFALLAEPQARQQFVHAGATVRRREPNTSLSLLEGRGAIS